VCETINLAGTPPSDGNLMGAYVLQPGKTTNGRPAYFSAASDKWLFYDKTIWAVGSTLGVDIVMFRAQDAAQTPDAITATWQVWSGSDSRAWAWVDAPSVKASSCPTPAPTPAPGCPACIAKGMKWCWATLACSADNTNCWGRGVCGSTADCQCAMCYDTKCGPPSGEVAVCTGKSASLPQSQCQAVVDLYDATSGGVGWTHDGQKLTCQRNDPCGTCSKVCTMSAGQNCMSEEFYGIMCNVGGTTVIEMYVPRLARPAWRTAP
jgi:hypothetical protein